MTTLAFQAFQSSSQAFQNYSKCIPQNTLKAVCKSALYTFTASAIVSGNPTLACAYGGLAAVTALVDSAITPIFSKICCSEENVNTIKWYESIAKRFVSLSIIQAVSGFNISSMWVLTNLFFVTLDRDGNTRNDITPSYLLFPVSAASSAV